MQAKLPSRCLALVLALLTCAGCAEVKHAGVAARTWMHNYSWGRYRATPQQTRLAHERASNHYAHLSPAKKKQMHESGPRYVAVRTLDPSPQQHSGGLA